MVFNFSYFIFLIKRQTELMVQVIFVHKLYGEGTKNTRWESTVYLSQYKLWVIIGKNTGILNVLFLYNIKIKFWSKTSVVHTTPPNPKFPLTFLEGYCRACTNRTALWTAAVCGPWGRLLLRRKHIFESVLPEPFLRLSRHGHSFANGQL